VTDALFGMPDKAPDEVSGYLRRLAGMLGLMPRMSRAAGDSAVERP
jgi:hypothetical protein